MPASSAIVLTLTFSSSGTAAQHANTSLWLEEDRLLLDELCELIDELETLDKLEDDTLLTDEDGEDADDWLDRLENELLGDDELETLLMEDCDDCDDVEMD